MGPTNVKAASKLSFEPTTAMALSMKDDGNKALFYCSLLALQYGLQPILSRKFSSPNASKNSIVIATELSKIVIATLSLVREPTAVREKIYAHWSISNCLKAAAIPAALYAVQNLLMQYGYSWLKNSMTVNLLNQTKTLSSALFLYLLLNQTQSRIQMFALLLLFIAAIVLTGKEMDFKSDGSNYMESLDFNGSNMDEGYYIGGVVVVLGASIISGLSTALTQKVLRSEQRNSVQFSGELAVFGITTLYINDWFQSQELFQAGGAFNGWTLETFIPVLSQAFGGIIVGFVTKYAGGVKKGFALIAGIVVTAIAEYVVEGAPLGFHHLLSMILVSLSIYLHNHKSATTTDDNNKKLKPTTELHDHRRKDE